jgi:hypothetical protein
MSKLIWLLVVAGIIVLLAVASTIFLFYLIRDAAKKYQGKGY